MAAELARMREALVRGNMQLEQVFHGSWPSLLFC